MGLSCRPFGEFKSNMRKLQNEMDKAEALRKLKKEQKNKEKDLTKEK